MCLLGINLSKLGGYRLHFPNNIIFLTLKIDFVKANSADPDEMPPYASLFATEPNYGFSVLRGIQKREEIYLGQHMRFSHLSHMHYILH